MEPEFKVNRWLGLDILQCVGILDARKCINSKVCTGIKVLCCFVGFPSIPELLLFIYQI